jgi:hypothetical protein
MVFYLRFAGFYRDFGRTYNAGSRVHIVAEVKQAEETLHKPLAFLANKLGNPRVFQLVKKMERPLQRGNVEILPLAGWLGSLDALCFKLFGAPRFNFGTGGRPNTAE